ncbi:MAG: hypothetical protein NXI24_20845 [bacterium]|nr:hypothetical protein [bacterium]
MQDYPTPRPGGWKIFVWFGLFFCLFDVVFFRFLFWQLPNESAWSEHPFYNFEYRAREAAAENPAPGTTRVVFAGSSLALYSVLPPLLESELARRLNDRPVEVKMLSHQGMSSMHLAAYADRILAARPDVVVVPVGTVDFRLERPIMQGIDRLNPADPMERRRALDESLEYTIAKPEFRMLAPGGWFREYHSDLDLNQASAALLASGIASYRYRLMFWRPVETLLDNRFSRGRSYHEYAGVPIGGEGITHRGWTGRVFELTVTPSLLRDGLLMQAPDTLVAAAAPGALSLTVERLPGGEGVHRRPLKSGWQSLDLKNLRVAAGDRLRFTLSHTQYAESGARERGVRLSRNAGRELKQLRDLGREPRREDDLYRGYTDAEYRESFERRILRFDRAGSEYLEALKQARHVWAARDFDAELPGFVAFDRFRKRLADAGVSLLIVNNPENPISLSWYGDSRWYADYLRYLSKGKGPGPYSFYEASRLLEMQMFYDYHHLSYYGAELYSRAVAGRLEEVLTDESTDSP